MSGERDRDVGPGRPEGGDPVAGGPEPGAVVRAADAPGPPPHPPEGADPLAHFRWHPEPRLLALRDPRVAREAVLGAGQAAWATAVDYLYDEGLRRGMGEEAAAGYDAARRTFFGPSARPGPAPAGPTALPELLEEFRSRLAPQMLNVWHPRTLSYFTPPPLISSVLGDMLAQMTQQGVDIWHAGPGAAFVEEEVVGWLCDLAGYGAGSFGLLTSGGTMANFIGLALAREVHLPRLLDDGRPPRGAALEGLRVYASDQAHFSVRRALDELGFPPQTLRVVASDERFRLRGEAVAEAIRADRDAGLLPLAIAAVAGSTNTGSVDAVGELADVAGREALWLHVDAAYGAAARLSGSARDRVRDLERADSVTVDPHKWFFQSYDIGAILVRDRSHLDAAFGWHRPEYLRAAEATGAAGDAGRAGGAGAPSTSEAPGGSDELDYYRLGFEGSRRWRALKLWLSWRHLGSAGLGSLVDMNLAIARYLARRIAASDAFEALPPEPELAVVCFRHLPGGRLAGETMSAAALDAHQDRLQAALEASGDGWLSTTRLRGATWLRAGILNHLTTEADIDLLLGRLEELAAAAT